MAGEKLAALVIEAKAERTTLERLAVDARLLTLAAHNSAHKAFMEAKQEAAKRLHREAVSLQVLVDTYCRSIVRLNAIILAAEASERAKEVCSEHKCFMPCFACFKRASGISD